MTAPETRSVSSTAGLAMAFAGGLMLTFDVPVLRLVAGDPWTVMFWRGLMMFAALLCFWTWARATGRISHGFVNGWEGLVVGLSYAGAGICFILSVHHTSVANLVFIMALIPLLAAMLSAITLRERTDIGTWIAIASALAGVWIIVRDGLAEGSGYGDLLAIGAAGLIAIALVLSRWSGKNFSTAPGIAGLVYAGVALVFVDGFALSATQAGWLGLNGLLIAPLSFALLALAPRYIPAVQVSMFQLLETVLAPIWIWIILNEVPARATLVGGSIVLATLFLHGLRLMHRRSRAVS